MNLQHVEWEKQFKAVVNSNPVIVRYPGYAISDKPIYTNDVQDCNVLVLLEEDGLCALSHYDQQYDPNEYLSRILHEMHMARTEDNLHAVLIGGHPDHFSEIGYLLEQLGIPIIGEYLDSYYPHDGIQDYIDLSYFKKEVIVIPSTHQVILYNKTRGYEELVPKE